MKIFINFLLSIVATLTVCIAFAQSDVTIGTDYKFNLQRKNNHGDAFILHNAEYFSDADVFKWTTTHGSFGMRGIRFSYSNPRGIYFYADDRASTAGATFTPYTRLFVGNNGTVGVNTVDPLGHFQVNAARPIIMKNNGSLGVYGSEIGFNAILNTTESPNKFKKLGGTSQKGGATIVVDHYGSMFFQMHNANNENESIINYSPQVTFSNSGFVGVGTISPGARLTVALPGYTGTPTHSSLAFVNQSSNRNGADLKPALEVSNNGGSGYGLVSIATNNYFSGKIGIGTTDPDTPLTVKGVIHTNEVRVDVNAPIAPDYVFEKDYSLLPLSEVEAYINQNKHLPEVPSAKEMEENGLNLKEMNLLLLKKVEELTLHLIAQDKKVEILQQSNDDLKKQNNEILLKLKKIESQ